MTYPASFGHETKTIEITQVAGAGGERTWHVFVDRYYVASIQLQEGEIRVLPGPGSWIRGDDMQALREVMEELTRHTARHT
jgi:hypothetical protein